MSNRGRIIGKLTRALATGGFLAVMVFLGSVSAKAHEVPSPCDFTTGGGWILIPLATAGGDSGLPESGDKANFGLVGGCKNGGFFGHINYLDHNNGLHVDSVDGSTGITGYLCQSFDGTTVPGSDGSLSPVCRPNTRDICAIGTTNNPNFPSVFIRVRTLDSKAPELSPFSQPPKDKFGIKLVRRKPDGTAGDVVYVVGVRCLAMGIPTFDTGSCGSSVIPPGGGQIVLHKANPSTTGPSGGDELCHMDDSGLGN
jgi:hypothetical protein